MGSYGGNGAAYFGMRISKVNREDPGGVISGSGKYGDRVSHIEIAQARTRSPKETLTGEEQAIFRPELGKLIWIARIARPGAIYDASAAAQTFPDGELKDVFGEGGGILENGGSWSFRRRKKRRFRTQARFPQFVSGKQKDVNKVNLLENKKIDTPETHFTVQNLIFPKRRFANLNGARLRN